MTTSSPSPVSVSESQDRWFRLEEQMFLDDAAWIASIGYAGQKLEPWGAPFAFAMVPHMARVVFEGQRLVLKRNPLAAKAIEDHISTAIAAARHAGKLLDDRKRGLETSVADLERIAAEHAAGLDPDAHFSVMEHRRNVVTTTSIAQFQGAVDFVEAATNPGEGGTARQFGFGIGRLIPVVRAALGYDALAIQDVLPPRGAPPRERVMDRKEYLATRFFPEFTPGTKDVLLMVEAAITSVLLIFDRTGEAFPNPLFRARFATATHALRTLQKIIEQHPDLSEQWRIRKFDAILSSARAQRLLGLGKLRNHCMHYGIAPDLEGLDPVLPFYGLVEATAPGHHFEAVNKDVVAVLRALARHFRLWHGGR